MRFFLIFLLVASSLLAKEKICYIVELLSIPAHDKAKISHDFYPNECQIMTIKNFASVRCGCYKHYTQAKNKLPLYQSKYKHAEVIRSYKFRFTKKKTMTQKRTQVDNESDEELRLLLQSFLYSNDLKNAYKVAKLGYKKHPHSYYWNQKLAEIDQWTGRPHEAMQHFLFLYKKNKKIAKNLINYGLKAYEYTAIEPIIKENVISNPTEKNVKLMIYIYSQTGEPEKAAKILTQLYKKNHLIMYLTETLQIYMNLGDLKSAKGVIDTIDQTQSYTIENVQLISYYYYIKKDMTKAYAVLHLIDYPKKYNKRFYELFSDLGWYVQSYNQAAKASKLLISHGNGRLVDFERAMYINRTNPTENATIALQAYSKFHHPYLFYTYAQNSIRSKKYAQLKETMETIEQGNSILLSQANYWLLQSEVYGHFNQNEKAKIAIKKALALAPRNKQIKFSAIYLYLNLGLYNKIKNMLFSITNAHDFSSSSYFSVASIYLSINEIDKASYYMDKLTQSNKQITQTIEFKFLQADIFRLQFQENGYIQKLREIQHILQIQGEKKPQLWHNSDYLNNYLRTQMQLANPDTFEKELHRAQKYLSQAQYTNLYYSWASRNKSMQLAHKIFLQTKNKELWLRLSNASQHNNHTTVENLLFTYLYSLPIDDASYAAQRDGQIALAQSLNYHALNTNQKDQNAYINMLNLSKKRDDLLTAKLSYYKRDPLLRKYIALKNNMYMHKGFYLLSNFHYYKNSLNSTDYLTYTPASSLDFSLGGKKLFTRGNITCIASYTKSMVSYYSFSIAGKYRVSKRLTFRPKIAKNALADESTELLLGGKKDIVSLGILYNILNSTSFEMKTTYNHYTSQDNLFLGTGYYTSISLNHQMRQGYPDIQIGLFTDHGIYKETSGSRGVINHLHNTQFPVLPNNFYNLGINFSYGMQNSTIYTRVWRPYYNISSYYNTDSASVHYELNVGYGGKVYSQDHLVLGGHYTNYVNGVGGGIFEVFLRYQFLYTQ